MAKIKSAVKGQDFEAKIVGFNPDWELLSKRIGKYDNIVMQIKDLKIDKALSIKIDQDKVQKYKNVS